MELTAFFKRTDIKEALSRIHAAAATPISLHTYIGDQESEQLSSLGQCEACKHVVKLPWGRQACRLSREKAVGHALRRKRPVPFICHMGFSCMAAPAVEGRDDCAFVLGPYCPAEAPDSLNDEALQGLNALEHQHPSEDLPFSTDDIARVAANAMPALAEWTTQTLTQRWNTIESAAETTDDGEFDLDAERAMTRPPGDPAMFARTHHKAAAIAAALLGNNRPYARTLLRGYIEDASTIKPMRARTLTIIGATLEAAEAVGVSTRDTWETGYEWVSKIQSAKNPGTLTQVAYAALSTFVPKHPDAESLEAWFQLLNQLLQEHLPEPIALEEVSTRMGQTSSAIAHRLKRRFGMTFTQYVGRIRVEKAKPLLAGTELNLKEIAIRIGLNDPSNFSRLFKKHEGLSPTAYRQQSRKARR